MFQYMQITIKITVVASQEKFRLKNTGPDQELLAGRVFMSTCRAIRCNKIPGPGYPKLS